MSEFNPDLFIFTRLGVGVKDPHWFESRLKFFEAITASSVSSQTYQNFQWFIFVGDDPFEFVVDQLMLVASKLGERINIIRSAQTPSSINRVIEENKKSRFLITALLDDDDAWDTSLLKTIVSDCHGFYKAGIERVGFTYPYGYEWLYADLIDIDELHKGKKIVRKAGCYGYLRPFLTMTSFTFSIDETNLSFIGGMHSSKGEILQKYNFEKIVMESDFPAWLYFRHQQADSAIHKAHQFPKLKISTEQICSKFGLNYELVGAIQANSENVPYAQKRILKNADKSSLLFRVSPDETYHNDAVKQSRDGKFVFELGVDIPKGDARYRVCIYDDMSKSYVLLKEVDANSNLEVSVAEFSIENKLRFKIQEEKEGRWADVVSFKKLELIS